MRSRTLWATLVLPTAVFIGGCDQATGSPEAVLAPAAAASSVAAVSVKEPFAGVAIACSTGEVIDLSGTLHVRSRVAPDGNGGYHASFHFQPMGVKGVGRTSGKMYRGTGVTRSTRNVSGSGYPVVVSEVNNFRIIGQGPGDNQQVHATTHTTYNANGVLTADVEVSSEECR